MQMKYSSETLIQGENNYLFINLKAKCVYYIFMQERWLSFLDQVNEMLKFAFAYCTMWKVSR